MPLVIIAICFLLFSYFGKYAPDIISHGGLSVKRLVGFQWFDQEAIFGIPIGVSVDFIFLFVLFGALLETAGGGKYFLDLAFAMVGKMRGGPAKAAILGSGMTGMISGSSIANTVTTGTFTIPIMKKTGFSQEKAGAIEVSSSFKKNIFIWLAFFNSYLCFNLFTCLHEVYSRVFNFLCNSFFNNSQFSKQNY
jgi:TRAP-type uncharacterized transport system fused permease subunit